MVGKFRLKKDTLGIVTATHIARPVPKGAIIEILIPPPDGVRLADIVYLGEPMMMFVQDILDRGEAIREE